VQETAFGSIKILIFAYRNQEVIILIRRH
jgi:hypothetical protein